MLQLSFAHVTVHNALKWLQLGTCDIVVEVAYESANGLVDIILNVFYQAEFRAIDVWTYFSEAHAFLPRGAVLVRDMLWHCVCPCAFHKSEFIKTVKHVIKQTTLHDSSCRALFFRCQKHLCRTRHSGATLQHPLSWLNEVYILAKNSNYSPYAHIHNQIRAIVTDEFEVLIRIDSMHLISSN